MLVDLPSDKEDSKMVIIKSEPENKDRDDSGYRDGYRDGTVSSVENNGGNSGNSDVKSGPMRCQKGLQLQLICCAPFRLLSQDFRMRRLENQRMEDQSEGQSCSWSRT